jgi:DNA repair ATPase RecN
VAAFADTQVAVEKAVESVGDPQGRDERNGALVERTVARAQVVADGARVAELSRMLAGAGSAAHARELAANMLAEASAARATGSPTRVR